MGSRREHQAVWTLIQAALRVPSQPQHAEGCEKRQQQGFLWLHSSNSWGSAGPQMQFSNADPRNEHDRTCLIMILPRHCNWPPAATTQKQFTGRAVKHLSLTISLWQSTAQLGSSLHSPCHWACPRQQQPLEPDLEPFNKTSDAINYTQLNAVSGHLFICHQHHPKRNN